MLLPRVMNFPPAQPLDLNTVPSPMKRAEIVEMLPASEPYHSSYPALDVSPPDPTPLRPSLPAISTFYSSTAAPTGQKSVLPSISKLLAQVPSSSSWLAPIQELRSSESSLAASTPARYLETFRYPSIPSVRTDSYISSSSTSRSTTTRGGRSSSMGSSSTTLTASPASQPEVLYALPRHRIGSATVAPTPGLLLGKLDDSAILSLDSYPFRRALFSTPAMQTFAILPLSLLENGLRDWHVMVKAAFQLVSSTATLSFASEVIDDSTWQSDIGGTIGQCMHPTRFGEHQQDKLHREIEVLMLCYVDAMRRGHHIPGLLSSIVGKLEGLEESRESYRRYKAVIYSLSVW